MALKRDARLELVLRRLLAVDQARDSLIRFAEVVNPTPDNPDDPDKSLYSAERFHHVMAAGLEALERGYMHPGDAPGSMTRLIINLPPRHGKTQLASKSFIPWYVGRHPRNSTIFGTYNDKFSQDIGRAVRDIMQHPAYSQIFPDTVLKDESQAADRLETTAGGVLAFVGRGGTTTGRGGDLLVVDDPVKDRAEADSATIRESMWVWFNQVLGSRMMNDQARVLVIQCMTGDTSVLMADGRDKSLRDVRPGDRVATYEHGRLAVSTVRNWINHGPDRVLAIRMKSGIVAKANARHPFLVEQDGKTQWRQTGSLKKGSVILRAITGSGSGSSVQQTGATSRQGAAACACPITASNAGRTVFGRLLSTLARTATRICATAMGLTSRSMKPSLRDKVVCAPSVGSPPDATCVPTGAASSASIIATGAGGSGVCSAMTAIWRSAMGGLRQSFAPPLTTFAIIRDVVEEVTEAGREDVFDIQVDRTENFIANGLVSHNTRWHEDDIVGRLTDPSNDFYDEQVARRWKIIELPALAMDNDVLGRKEGEALWPRRFGVGFLKDQRRQDPRGFSALYQGRPSPQQGNFFRSEWLGVYRPNQLPQSLRIYGASDHAVSLVQGRDKTALVLVGVDEQDDLWILPQSVLRQLDSNMAVDTMLGLIREHKPLFWWAERGQVSKSIGPFLRKRMLEESVYCSIIELTPVMDKQTRAQSIQGRMAMRKVHFPEFANWWPEVRDQILKFPHAAHDDFCFAGDTPVLMADGREVPIRDVRVDDRVATPSGPRRVLAAGQTNPAAAVFRVRLSDGRVLVGTGNHPVWVQGRGFVRLDALAYNAVLWQSAEQARPRWWNTQATVTGDTQRAGTGTISSISMRLSRAAAFCTGTSGRIRSALFRRGGTYITRTATAVTTRWTTWSACRLRSTAATTYLRVVEHLSTWTAWLAFAPMRLLGTLPRRALPGIGSTGGVLGPGAPQASWFACAVVRRLRPTFRHGRGSAIKPAVRVLSVEALTTPSAVYNLTVQGSPVYFAAGVLVHNCDALAYIGLGLQQQVPFAPVRRKHTPGPNTFGALLAQRRQHETTRRAARSTGGW